MTTNPNLLTPFKATKADAESSSSLRQISEDAFYVINEVVTRRLGHIPILKGDLHDLPYKVQRFVAEKAELMRPRGIFICDGSQHEAEQIISKLIERGMLTPLAAYENNYLCRTDPKDVARVESKTWMVTPDKYQTVTHTAPGAEPIMGHWMSPLEFGGELDSRFPGCMAGRIMYVIPFSMGPLGSPLSKIGIQLTDSNYVVLSMRIMTRVNPDVWEVLGNNDFVRCIHSVGLPRPVKQRVINHWPCNPERVLIAHRPSEREIWSFGSGYGGNSLLGKKCFALRIASNIGLEDEIKDKNVEITDWLGNPWKLGDAAPAAHPNSRFAAPAKQCPIIHPDWESPTGVPIEAIIFGGRRPDGVPLVFETFGWHHGIFTGACLKSETTAAAEHKGKNVMHDPMAMRPFMGYNFGKYLDHWISLEKAPHKVPKIYHVNWFRKSKEGKFLWPGFGDNIRVIDWIIRRLDGEEGIGIDTAVGVVPSPGSINLDGLGNINWDELMSLPADYWKQDAKEVRKFLEDQVGSDLPKEIREELAAQEKRIEAL
uniref:Phosphoenolpyruvate carboxykinase (GTP) n=1 Tax=Panagrolaimus sp. ES5 TaxID=591445 RepID=A0AC34FWT4_9BILA